MAVQIIDLTGLSSADGFIVQGDADNDSAGNSVSNVGDINGDGIDDFLVGALNANVGYSDFGKAYVIFGKTGATRPNIDLSSLSATDGFVVQGAFADEFAGVSVSDAGDINGDGIDDMIIGATSSGGPAGYANPGRAYVIFGKSGATRSNIDLANLSSSDGFIIFGDADSDRAGFSVSGGGDINGDGIADLVVGAFGSDDGGNRAGEAFVIFGKSGATRTNIDLTTLAATDGFNIRGDAAGDSLGISVSHAGDVNGDGIDDVVLGASLGDSGGSNSGQAYVIFGKSGATRTNIDLTTLAASDGFAILGDVGGDYAGRSVSNAGDVNGDGIDDVIIGALNGDDGGFNAGEAYVIFGKSGATRATIDLSALAATDGFIIIGGASQDQAGRSVSAAGDVNGDGIGDILVGAPGNDGGGSNAGAAYVIFGKTGATRGNIDLATLTTADGLIIRGDAAIDVLGVSVSAAGDINGDGIDDLIVGAPYGDDGGNSAGEAYIIYGKRSFSPITGTTGDDTLTGTAGDDTIEGDAGNDVLIGGTGNDTMRGGTGNDIYVVADAGDVVTEASNEGTDRVETTLAAYTLGANVENLEYTGAGAFTGTGNSLANIIIGADGNDTLSGGDGDDTLGGEVGDDILNGGDGNDRLNGGIDGIGVDTLNGGAGNDFLVVDNFFGDVANGGDGYDTLQIDASISGFFGSAIAPYVIAADIEAVQVLSAPAVSVRLNALDNLMGGSIGDDYVFAGAGNDSVYGRGGADYLVGEDGNDKLFGEAGQDQLYGGNGTDLLYGGADNDYIEAGAGNDTLYGEGGNDTLLGGAGIDQLFGGAGADLFRFVVGDSGTTTTTADRIRDFAQAQGDRIDLSAIDANALGGTANDAFSFIGSAAFSNVAGQLRAVVSSGNTFVSGDVNGDGVADFLIRIDGVHALAAGDFIL